MRELSAIFLTTALFIVGIGCSVSDHEAGGAPAPGLPIEARQVLVIRADPNGPATRAKAVAWSLVGKKWDVAIPTMDAVIGRSGFVSATDKREGDGCTPTGAYRLARAFGYDKVISTGLEYHQVGRDDYWVDDPAEPAYNCWIRGKPQRGTAEQLKREDGLYACAAVIEYNTDPVYAGKGSAIFLHIWRDGESPTSGCVAMAEKDLRLVLAWLDKKKSPMIAIGHY